ncbi:MAG: HD domain-containing protein [Gemmatimonadota bacterium]
MLPSSSSTADEFEVIRDSLWNTIRIDPIALRIIDSPAFQRLRHIRQLGHAYLVYPGATHTRFEHALGVYHLARRALQLLGDRGELDEVDPVDCRVVPYAALLHDIGHYPFSHALEELGADQLTEHHESLTRRFLASPELAAALTEVSPDAADRIEQLIRGWSRSPLQGLIAGSLDLDKIEYLNRDARSCGVPYGTVDVDRLIHALTLLRDPDGDRLEIGIHEKGLSALESLLFAKYQMFRNVYWHHGVRAATALYKRAVQEAIASGLIAAEELVGRTDDGLLALLDSRASDSPEPAAVRLLERWLPALRDRKLPKRILEVPGEVVRKIGLGDWFGTRPDLRNRMESRIAGDLDLPDGSVFLDYPEKPRMMGLDLLLLQRDGRTVRLPESGHAGLIDLPRVADELYHSARMFRVFSTERRTLDQQSMLTLLARPPIDIERRLHSPKRLV